MENINKDPFQDLARQFDHDKPKVSRPTLQIVEVQISNNEEFRLIFDKENKTFHFTRKTGLSSFHVDLMLPYRAINPWSPETHRAVRERFHYAVREYLKKSNRDVEPLCWQEAGKEVPSCYGLF